MKRAAEERRREKEQAKKDKERVRAQIAEDKERRKVLCKNYFLFLTIFYSELLKARKMPLVLKPSQLLLQLLNLISSHVQKFKLGVLFL